MQVILDVFPRTAEEIKLYLDGDFKSPFIVSALFVVALCVYAYDRDECFRIIDVLKGPQRLNAMERQFLHSRLMGKSGYMGRAFLMGATPENDYSPSTPHTVLFVDNPDIFAEDGYATLLVHTGGSDRPRPLKLRQKGEMWFLWQYAALLADLKMPVSLDPWREL